MVEIVSQLYNKTYCFSYLSYTFLIRFALLILTVVAPFFIVYKTGNFYQNSKTQFLDLSSINLKPTYEYYISLKTTSNSRIFTNLFTYPAYQSITIKFTEEPLNSLKIKIEYMKKIAQKVKQIDVYVPFQYQNYNKTSYGIIRANVKGIDLAQTATYGFLEFKDGTGDSPILKSDNSKFLSKTVLKKNKFEFLPVFQQFYKSSSYLAYRYNAIPINLPTDVFRLSIVVNYPSIKVQEHTPSILGQLIWCWIQYFPIFFIFYLGTDYILAFLLKQNLLKNTLKHDKQFIEIVRQQKDRKKDLSRRFS